MNKNQITLIQIGMCLILNGPLISLSLMGMSINVSSTTASLTTNTPPPVPSPADSSNDSSQTPPTIGGSPSSGSTGISIGGNPESNPTSPGSSSSSTGSTIPGDDPNNSGNDNSGITIGGNPEPSTPSVNTNLIFLSASHYYAPAMAAYNAATSAAQQKVSIGISSAPAAYTPISSVVIQDYKTALTNFAQMYNDPAIKSGQAPAIVIDGGNTSNYIIATIMSMENAFIQNLTYLVSLIIQKISTGDSVESLLKQLVSQSKAYDSDIVAAQTYVQKNWSSLYTPFHTEIENLLEGVFLKALKYLSSVPITDAVMAQAILYFSSIKGAVDKVPADIAAEYSAIALNAFTTTLGLMRPEASIISLADAIGPNALNRQMLSKALVYINEAAQASGTTSLGSQYAGWVQALTQAQTSLDAALGYSDVPSQVSVMTADGQNPLQLLTMGGAGWLSAHLGAVTNIIDAQYQQTLLSKSFADLDSYSDTISSISKTFSDVSVAKFIDLSDFFKALSTDCKNTITTFTNITQLYSDALVSESFSNGPTLTSGQISAATTAQTNYDLAPLVQACAQASDDLVAALALLGSDSIDSAAVESAQEQIADALNEFSIADLAYGQILSTTSKLFPFYAKIPNASLSSFAAQYIVQYYMILASKLDDQTDDTSLALASSYYLNAFTIANDAANGILDTVKSAILEKLTSFGSVIQSAQKALVSAKSLDATYKKNKEIVDSILADSWTSALTQSYAGYLLWSKTQSSDNDIFKDGPIIYRQTIASYLASYRVQSGSDSSIEKMSLTYRHYLLVLQSPQDGDPNPATLLKTVTSEVEAFFKAGNTAFDAAKKQDSENGYTGFITALQNLYTWQQNAESLVNENDHVVSDQQAASTDAKNLIALIAKTSTDTSTCATSLAAASYSSPLVKSIKTVSVENLVLEIAQAYQKRAEWAVNNAVSQSSSTQAPTVTTTCSADMGYHGIASQAYSMAQTYYTQACNTGQAQAMSALQKAESALILPDLFANSVKPVGGDSSTFAQFMSMTAFAKYFISPWLAMLPTDATVMPSTLLSNQTKYAANQSNASLKAALTKDYLDLGASLYLYHHIFVAGQSLDDYITPIVTGKMPAGISNDVKGFVRDALNYRKQLNGWMTSGLKTPDSTVLTTLGLWQPSPTAGYSLVYCNVPAMPTPPPAKSKNQSSLAGATLTAMLVYEYALSGYASFIKANTDQSVQQQITYATNMQATTTNNLIGVFLSEVYALWQKIQYMQGATVDPTILDLVIFDISDKNAITKAKASLAKKTSILSLDNKKDKNVAPYMAAISLINAYYSVAMPSLQTLYQGVSNLISPQPDAIGLIGYLYEAQGDFLAASLTGDPQALGYKNLLNSAYEAYISAQGAYKTGNLTTNVATVQTKIAQLYQTDGDTLTAWALKNAVKSPSLAGAHYVDAMYQYNKAWQAYQAANDAQNATKMGLQIVMSGSKASTEYFVAWYSKRWAQSILPASNIKTFDELLGDCNVSLSPNKAAQKLCTSLKNNILDALVYNDFMSQFLTSLGTEWSLSLPAASTSSTTSSTTTTDLDPTITAYLQKNSITDLSSSISTNGVKASTLRSLMNGLILNGSTDLSGLIDLTSSTDKTNLIAALAVTADWLSLLNTSISQSYISSYNPTACTVGGSSASQACLNAYSDLTTEVQTQGAAIASPTKQIIGKK